MMEAPTTHQLKTWPEYFAAIVSGAKTFEIRFNDRNFKVGDQVVLTEWDPDKEEHTGNLVKTVITYILDDQTWLQPGYVALGLMMPLYGPDLTSRQMQELTLNCLSVAIQGAKSEYHKACGEVVIFYLPLIARELNEDPATLLLSYIQNIRNQLAKSGLLSMPFDKSFYSFCLEAWSAAG